MAITDVAARTAKPREKEFKLTDSHGLYLLVKPTGSKRWYLKYHFEVKESRDALGVYPLVSLAKAHGKRDEIRLLLAEGITRLAWSQSRPEYFFRSRRDRSLRERAASRSGSPAPQTARQELYPVFERFPLLRGRANARNSARAPPAFPPLPVG